MSHSLSDLFVLLFTLQSVIFKTHAFVNLEECLFLDLTHPFNRDTLYWPTAKSFQHNVTFKNFTDKGYFYSSFDYGAAEHGGTHLDAPIHFYEYGTSVEKIPLTRLVGECCLLDVVDNVKNNKDYQVTVDDVRKWEKQHGSVRDCILIIRTGYEMHWKSFEKYMGTERKQNKTETAKNLHFPGIKPDTAKYLVSQKIKSVGIDTASLDYGQSKEFKSHQVLFESNIPGLENLNMLENLPPRGATIIALPMKIEGGSGAPTRVIAVGWNGPKDYCRRNSATLIIVNNKLYVILTTIALIAKFGFV